jgi:hypothetical protein
MLKGTNKTVSTLMINGCVDLRALLVLAAPLAIPVSSSHFLGALCVVNSNRNSAKKVTMKTDNEAERLTRPFTPGTEITSKVLQHTLNEVVSVRLSSKEQFEGIVLSRTTAGAVVASGTSTLGEWFANKFLRTTKEAQAVCPVN